MEQLPDLAQFQGNSLLPSQGLSQDRIPLTCPCIPGEDGLTLDVTGTQLVEKDIENLARGEVKSVKWGYTVLGGVVEGCYSYRNECEKTGLLGNWFSLNRKANPLDTLSCHRGVCMWV